MGVEDKKVEDAMNSLPIVYLDKVNRVEVIDSSGRVYTNWQPNNNVNISVQDEGRTLKVFIS